MGYRHVTSQGPTVGWQIPVSDQGPGTGTWGTAETVVTSAAKGKRKTRQDMALSCCSTAAAEHAVMCDTSNSQDKFDCVPNYRTGGCDIDEVCISNGGSTTMGPR